MGRCEWGGVSGEVWVGRCGRGGVSGEVWVGRCGWWVKGVQLKKNNNITQEGMGVSLLMFPIIYKFE